MGLDIQVKELKEGAHQVIMSVEGYAMFKAALSQCQPTSLHDFDVTTTRGKSSCSFSN